MRTEGRRCRARLRAGGNQTTTYQPTRPDHAARAGPTSTTSARTMQGQCLLGTR